MNRVPIGHILILRDEFATISNKQHEAPAIRRRAQIVRELLDELIDRREKEVGANG